jgi:hypothetical protein
VYVSVVEPVAKFIFLLTFSFIFMFFFMFMTLFKQHVQQFYMFT